MDVEELIGENISYLENMFYRHNVNYLAKVERPDPLFLEFYNRIPVLLDLLKKEKHIKSNLKLKKNLTPDDDMNYLGEMIDKYTFLMNGDLNSKYRDILDKSKILLSRLQTLIRISSISPFPSFKVE